MDLDFTPEQQAFRAEVRDFIAAAFPADLRAKTSTGKRLAKEDMLRWQRILYEKGWGAAWWPVEFGGTGWDAVQKHIFDEELAAAGTPVQVPFGLKMVAPVIQRFGTAEQQQRFLPGIISGQDWWCQGYSEPGAGSDLASLKTRAELRGDHYVVNGQKTWTTLAQYADWIFCLVRTNPEARKQEGISFLLIDMKTPGITVRPIIMLDGEHEVNEVFFDNVRVPLENRIGEENKGWTYAKYLLGHERTNIAGVGRSKAALRRLKALAARQPGDDGRPLIDDPRFRDRLVQLELELLALEITNLKLLSAEGKAQAPGPEASILKVKGSEIQQMLTELATVALGPYALPYIPEGLEPDWTGESPAEQYMRDDFGITGAYFNNRKTTIYGGSNEVQKNIISQIVLGL